MHASTRQAYLALSLLAASAIGGLLPGVTGAAFAQAAKSEEAEGPAPKQVALTQKTIDNLITAQKQIRALEAGQSGKNAPDAKAMEAKMDGIAKKNGFASASDFADASYSVGLVLAGIDPDSGNYIGTQAALKKQIDDVKADKKMPANEKKEALDELNDAMKSASGEKPMQANIDLVKTNATKLTEGMQQGD